MHHLLESPEPFFIGTDIEIDPLKQIIILKGDEQKVEPQLIQLLLLLVSAKGQIVSRDKIFETVWPGMVVTQNSLNQSVSKLRKLLGDSTKSPSIIVTNPRQGYSFIAEVNTINTDATLPTEDKVTEEASAPVTQEPAIQIPPNQEPTPRSNETTLEPNIEAKNSHFSKLLLGVVIVVFMVISLTYAIRDKEHKTIVVSPAPVLIQGGEIPPDPIGHAISGYVFSGLRDFLKSDNIDIRFECHTPAARQLCPEDYEFDRAKAIEVKPLIRYLDEHIKLNLIIDGVNSDIELKSTALSLKELDQELDDLLLELLNRFAHASTKKQVIAKAVKRLKLPHNPELAVDRLQLTAFAYSQDVEYDAEFVAKLKASTRSCSIDCPLVNGAYGRVLLNVFLDGNQPETLQQAVHYLTKGLPEELPETRLKLAVAYALQGNFDQARALQASLDRVSFPGVKKALDYYLSMRSTGTNKVPPRLKYRNKVAEYLIKNATAGPIARPAVD